MRFYCDRPACSLVIVYNVPGLQLNEWVTELTDELTAAESNPKKLTGFQLVKKFPAFHGTRRFITAFASARHLSLSWARSIQSTPPQPTYLISTLILSSHLHRGLYPTGLPTKTLYALLLFPIRAAFPAHLQVWSLVKCFVTWLSFYGGVVSNSPDPRAGGPSTVGCPRLLIWYILIYPPHLEAVPASGT